MANQMVFHVSSFLACSLPKISRPDDQLFLAWKQAGKALVLDAFQPIHLQWTDVTSTLQLEKGKVTRTEMIRISYFSGALHLSSVLRRVSLRLYAGLTNDPGRREWFRRPRPYAGCYGGVWQVSRTLSD